jgi:tRNA-dihydrouridine synthase B
MNRIEDCDEQLAALDAFLESQLAYGERLQYAPVEPAVPVPLAA